ncbi:class I SAM-dependent methyltransferase [Actinoplanes aureus]|uniref:Methyltransferase domain-containing protein n=1 Tax=Actinoplanes aureus TaxID=2792083 RepID=A0A931CID9_9ACTN|nr:methyltransferase domain-containing protein [Actinoplanes aureus]MBG0567696.1 methyltransferase domain-containing protein [Actinoplanes aureus]
MTEQTYALSAEAADFYESTFVPALFGEWARRLVEAAGVRPGERVLDVACGTGIVARTAADRAGTTVGVDRSDAMLAVARRIRPDLRWEPGDAHALPFGDRAFDVALSQAALMFFADRVAALREMGRVAGRVAVQVPGRLSHSAGYRVFTEAVPEHAELIGAYFAAGDPDELAGWLEQAGLRVDRFDSWVGATRAPSIDAFVTGELLPLGVTANERITAACRAAMAGFVGIGGSVAVPIEAHLVVATPAR